MDINQIRSKKIIVLVGYIGVAIVFLSSAAYSIQVTVNPQSATGMLAFTFCVINLVGWLGGNYARKNLRTYEFGTTLLVLGDVIFPLNLYAPFFLYVLLLKGQIFHSASMVILIGVGYHLMGYLRREQRRFSVIFYPYFFAGSIAALIYLTRFTLGLPNHTIVWMLVGFAIAFQFLADYGNLQPGKHFSSATLGLLIATATVTAMAIAGESRVEYLAALLLIAVILFRQASVLRDRGPLCRFFGLAFFAVLTTFFTACLYYFHSPAAGYVVATTVWVGVLTALGIRLKDYKFYAFQEAAYWLSVLLGLGMVVYWSPFWSTLAALHFQLPFRHALALPFAYQFTESVATLAPLSLLGVSVAFLLGSYWKRRYPNIALSKAGLVFNVTLVTITAYLPLLLFIAAGTGIWLSLSATAYGAALVPFVFAVIYLYISKEPNRLYPMITLKVAGYIALFVSALTAVFSVDLAILIIFCSSLVFLWRSISERSSWMHLSFLFMITAATTTTTMRFPERTGLLALSLLSVTLVGIYRWMRLKTKMHFESRITLFWGFALGVIVAIAEWRWGHFSPVVFLPLWLGLLLGLGEYQTASAWMPGKDLVDRKVMQQFRRLKIVGYWVAHLAGAAWLISLLRTLQTPSEFDALALAVWCWLHFGISYLLTNQASERLASIALQQVIHGLAFAALALAIFNPAISPAPAIAAFLIAAFYLLLCRLRGRRFFQDPAAWAFIEAVYLLGLQLKVDLPEFYLGLFGFYLCFILWRRSQRQATELNPLQAKAVPAGRFKRGLRFVWRNLLAISVMVMMVGYPVWAFSESLQNAHIYFLGLATVVLLYLFMATRQSSLLIYLICLTFLQGAIYLLIFGQSGEQVNLFLVVVGTLILINQVFLGARSTEEFSVASRMPVTQFSSGD
jgi:hypothetical protein